MVRTAELAERLDVRLHTHFAENAEDDEFSRGDVRLPADGVPGAHRLGHRPHVGRPLRDARRGGDPAPRRCRCRAAHCPSSNLILASGIAPVVDLRAAGVEVGLGVDGSSSADSASLWLEARQAMLLAKLRNGPRAGTARMALEIATLGGAGCLGRERRARRARPGAVGDVAIWSLTGPRLPAPSPIRSRPGCAAARTAARDTIVAGRPMVATACWCRPGRRDARRPQRARGPNPATRRLVVTTLPGQPMS